MNQKPFKCEVYFGLKYDLNLHIASVHEVKKPFKCEICDVQFEVENKLNEHVTSVHKEKIISNILSVRLSLIKCLI